MSALETLERLQNVDSNETGSYPIDLLCGWFEEDLDPLNQNLIREFTIRFNRMNDKQRMKFINFISPK